MNNKTFKIGADDIVYFGEAKERLPTNRAERSAILKYVARGYRFKRAGWPDYLVEKDGIYEAVEIKLEKQKHEKNGGLSEDQVWMKNFFEFMGIKYNTEHVSGIDNLKIRDLVPIRTWMRHRSVQLNDLLYEIRGMCITKDVIYCAGLEVPVHDWTRKRSDECFCQWVYMQILKYDTEKEFLALSPGTESAMADWPNRRVSEFKNMDSKPVDSNTGIQSVVVDKERRRLLVAEVINRSVRGQRHPSLIADEIGLHKTIVWGILDGRIWRDVTPDCGLPLQRYQLCTD